LAYNVAVKRLGRPASWINDVTGKRTVDVTTRKPPARRTKTAKATASDSGFEVEDSAGAFSSGVDAATALLAMATPAAAAAPAAAKAAMDALPSGRYAQDAGNESARLEEEEEEVEEEEEEEEEEETDETEATVAATAATATAAAAVEAGVGRSIAVRLTPDRRLVPDEPAPAPALEVSDALEEDNMESLAEARAAVAAERKGLETEQMEVDSMRAKIATDRRAANDELRAQLDAAQSAAQSLEEARKVGYLTAPPHSRGIHSGLLATW
jgi:hypothetical protein